MGSKTVTETVICLYLCLLTCLCSEMEVEFCELYLGKVHSGEVQYSKFLYLVVT